MGIYLSDAPGVVQRIVIVRIASFDKSTLHTLPPISPRFAGSISNSFLESK